MIIIRVDKRKCNSLIEQLWLNAKEARVDLVDWLLCSVLNSFDESWGHVLISVLKREWITLIMLILLGLETRVDNPKNLYTWIC